MQARQHFLNWSLLVAFGLLQAPRIFAQNVNLLRPADTSSPRATLTSFIEASNDLIEEIQKDRNFSYRNPTHAALARRMFDCMDMSELPEFAREMLGAEAAVCLKEILDRVELPPIDEIPDVDQVDNTDSSDRFMRWRIPGTRITLARVVEGPQRHEYLFSAGTVARAVEYYEEIQGVPYRTTGPETSPGFHDWYLALPGHWSIAGIVDVLPDWTKKTVLRLTIWKWIGLVLCFLISLGAMVLLYWMFGKTVTSTRQNNLARYCLAIVLPILAVFVPFIFKDLVRYYLTIRGTPLYVVIFIADVTALVAGIIVVFAACNRIGELVISSPRIQPHGLDAQFIRIVSRLTSLLGSTVIFIEGGRHLGIPITTLLAGAGVGGLAVALAAQSTLKDLLGTILILLDKPYRVGERIILRNYDGLVEEIGLRSTKIRLLTGHVACIPNDVMAHTEIENVGRRPHIRRVTDLHIPLSTSREKVEQAIQIIRTALENHEGMDPEFPPRVFFNEFNPDSFNIRILYWYAPASYWDFLAFSERVNLQIFEAFDQQGIPFTLPHRVTYTNSQNESSALPLEMEERGTSEPSESSTPR